MYLDNHITKDEDYTVLNALGVALMESDGLHTKRYLNESEMIAWSMNL